MKTNPYHIKDSEKKTKVNDAPVLRKHLCATRCAHQNLTLNDRLTVFAYIDAHQAISQGDIVISSSFTTRGAPSCFKHDGQMYWSDKLPGSC